LSHYQRRIGLWHWKFTTSYLEDSPELFRCYKKLAARGMEQVTDEQLFAILDEESNSIAIVVKHMAGNMQSRWTDFLTTDGKKPTIDRHIVALPSGNFHAAVDVRERNSSLGQERHGAVNFLRG
jgi:hypothetical protein